MKVGADQVEVTVDCERLATVDSGVTCQLRWGGGRAFKPDEERRFLTEAVSKKVKKNYSKPKQPFWLLAYSTDTVLFEGDPDIVSSVEMLNKQRHPFDVVWYFYPYQNENLGHLVQIWRR